MDDIDKLKNTGSHKAAILSQEEIQRLIHSPVDTKIHIAKNIVKYYEQDKYEDGQIEIAEQIFRIMLKDTETKVRKSLAEAIKSIEGVPHDVVLELAKDMEEVSLPILEFSDVLSDVDLVHIIVSTKNEQQHLAITKRKKINEGVSEALIDTKNEKVVGNLMQNTNAAVS